MKIFNTLTRKKEEFIPIKDSLVGMYTCGPTVHDYMHIGNLRTFLTSDLLHRALLFSGYKLTSVRNITDIEDKIIRKAKEKKISIRQLTSKYIQLFLDDLKDLNILPVTVNPRATKHIKQMITYIEVLINKGLAYVEEDGSVYFKISSFPRYGRLSRLDTRKLKSGARVSADEYTKNNVQDFALWKAVNPDEVGYQSPWGRGRPGWHIECSVMSQKYLGDTFDIHTGGVDLIFPHHENEIAQSEGKTGKKFVNYFVHGEHLLVNDEKMSKSLGNIITLRDIMEKGFESLSLRYLFLTSHYRDKLNFTWKSLESAQNALNNIRKEVRDWDKPDQEDDEYLKRFIDKINNDLNTPQALAELWELIHSNLHTSVKAATLLEMDKILGLGLKDYFGEPVHIPKIILEIVKEREIARKNNDYREADNLRNKLKKMGYIVEDTDDGPKIKNS